MISQKGYYAFLFEEQYYEHFIWSKKSESKIFIFIEYTKEA